jgi:hypothetical protein
MSLCAEVQFSGFMRSRHPCQQGLHQGALAQLPEYSLWPGAQEAERLVIVGKRALDVD